LYQGFAVGPSSWDIFWLYCRGQSLVAVFDEGVGTRPLFSVSASGSCAETEIPDVDVSLPALSIASPLPIGGYTVRGKDIVIYSDGTGTLTINGQSMPLIVFSPVDCSFCSSSEGWPGWYELHSIVWDKIKTRAIFMIIYLHQDNTNEVGLGYIMSLPDLVAPIGDRVMPAVWSLSSRRFVAKPTFPAHIGIPPPSLVKR
jgi:hypothetical protein